MACILIFAAFSFFYLLRFQADVLFYAQYSLSEGTVHFSPLFLAAVVTLALLLLTCLLALTCLKNYSFLPAVFHLPSALLLASICDVHIVETNLNDLFGTTWIWCAAITLILVIGNFLQYKRRLKITYRSAWQAAAINLFGMILILIVAVFAGNTHEGTHERLRCERCILAGDYEGVIRYVNRYAVNMPETAMMKAYAMAQTGQMGERFFEQNVMNGSESLFPIGDNILLMLSPTLIFEAVGGTPAKGMTGRKCLELLYDCGDITPVGREYLYVACLLDRDLDAFVKYYAHDADTTAADIPKHYAEALEIYRHRPTSMTDEDELASEYAAFSTLRNSRANKMIRENELRDLYGDTYWFYYFFTSSSAFTQSVSNEN